MIVVNRLGETYMPASFAVGWRQVGACFLLLAASGMIAPTYSIVAVPLAQEFHPTRTVLMLTMTVLSTAGALLSPFFGALMDRVSLRTLMIIGGLLLGAGYAAVSLAATFNQVLIIFGLLIAPANVLIGPVAVTVLLSRWFAKRRGRAVGIAIAGISAGSFLFPIIIQGLFNIHEWREALRLLGIIVVVWTIPAAFLVVDRPGDRGLNPDGDVKPPEMSREELAKAPFSARALLTDPAFWMIALTIAIVTSGMKGMITNLAPLAIDNGIVASTAATLISVYSACSFTAKLSFAALSDRFGPRVLMFVSLIGFAAGMGCLTQAALGYKMIALGVALIGLFGGLMVPTESYLAPRVFGQRAVGRAMGLLTGVTLCALLSTPPLFGLIFDLTGSYKGIFWTFCGLGLVALLWVPAIRLHPREPSPTEPSGAPLSV
jgi:MFS family permease